MASVSRSQTHACHLWSAGGAWDYVISLNMPPAGYAYVSAVPQRIRSAGTTFPIMSRCVEGPLPAEPGLRWPWLNNFSLGTRCSQKLSRVLSQRVPPGGGSSSASGKPQDQGRRPGIRRTED